MSKSLGKLDRLSLALTHLATTIDKRAGTDPSKSYTAKMLVRGPLKCAKKYGEEAVEFSLAVAAESDTEVAAEAADALFHMFLALRARGVSLDAVGKALIARQGMSGLQEKAARPKE